MVMSGCIGLSPVVDRQCPIETQLGGQLRRCGLQRPKEL
jgi:hypothetical protein